MFDGRRCWPAQPGPGDIGLIARLAQRLAFWALQGISDAQVRDRTFELSLAELILRRHPLIERN
jgi:hypothetical protein